MSIAFLRRLSVLGLVLVCGCASSEIVLREAPPQRAVDRTRLDRTAAELDVDTNEHLAWAVAYRARILEADGPRTIRNTLMAYNELMMRLDSARWECELFARVHPDERVRRAAGEGERAVIRRLMELRLDRELYDVFRALDTSGADDTTRYLVHKVLRDFRRAGVDKTKEVRNRIAELNEAIAQLGREFSKNIRDDERVIIVASPANLIGLPVDWIAKHPPGFDGMIQVTTRPRDYFPIMAYAHDPELRRNLYHEFNNRGYPENLDTLQKLLAKRYELAQLLGYANWANHITEDRMIRTSINAQSFIDRIAQISREPAERDYTALLERKRRDFPDARSVEDWERSYYETLVRAEWYSFDPRSVRPYFNFSDVLKGLFDLTEKLFGITYQPVSGLKLWHPDVTAWDIYDGKVHLGRFYLDLHARVDKFSQAAQFDYRTGIAGKRLPQAVLVGSFANPADDINGIALMEHSEVETLFHEFGHLLHTIFSGHRRWIGNGGISTEWDFIEAPSQVMEEWCSDLDTLQLFAKHYRTGEPIPEALVEKLRRAGDFGKGLRTANQTFYAAVSLKLHTRDPNYLDITKLVVDLRREYTPFAHVDDTYSYCSFSHLDADSACYYTYLWSQVIAKDLFSRFIRDGVLNPTAARQYRETILEPGGSKRAAEMISDFLGRPYSFNAFEAWMNRT